MSFILTRPPSPRDHPHQEEDTLSAALHAALSPFSSNSSHHAPHPPLHPPHDPDMHREKADRLVSSLDIVVTSDVLCLKGTGVDVNPALLSGNVVLHLSEPTAIKEIVLQFRGKARLPVSASEPLSLSSSQLTYLVCNHEWSFLEGNRSHAHTLKAGRHLFPFQLQIGGSLPSSISTTALGGASVQYKLRATAVRSGFSITHRDLQAACPITIMRGFSSEALEYQQTLEIENTWPEKLMYSIMIPHKAWAAGEKVTAVVKFSPLVKGAAVLNVTTTINETTKLYARQAPQESTRVVASSRHDIVDGKAVCVDEQHHRYRIPLLHHGHTPYRHSTSTSTPASPGFAPGHGHHLSAPNGASSTYFSHSHTDSLTHSPAELALTTTTTNSSSSSEPSAAAISRLSGPLSSTVHSITQHAPSHDADAPIPPLPPPDVDSDFDMQASSDVVTTLSITVPLHTTPSHSLEPIQVSHRIRWSILIGNHDGHTSELRCSLPLHVLDAYLYDEARAATLATRRLLLGAQDVEGGEAVGVHGEEGAEDDMDLPSYPAHVRDRVANAYLPEAAVMRVMNPWVMQGVSPTIAPPFAETENSSGIQSPAGLETWAISSSAPASATTGHHHLPHDPSPGAQPLEWVNTELLLSLSREAPEVPLPPVHRTTPPHHSPLSDSAPGSRPTSQHGSRPSSRIGSRFPSRRPSRAPSRSGSPERGERTAAAATTAASAPPPAIFTVGTPGETYVHSGSTASRNMHGLFNIAMKPFTSLTSTFSLGARSQSHASLHGLHGSTLSSIPSAAASTLNLHGGSGAETPGGQVPMTSPQLLHRAFTEVPDYDMASRGFLGGGITPLTSMRGLPSYEAAAAERSAERAERSFSETDLAGMFASARRAAPPRTASSARLGLGAAS